MYEDALKTGDAIITALNASHALIHSDSRTLATLADTRGTVYLSLCDAFASVVAAICGEPTNKAIANAAIDLIDDVRSDEQPTFTAVEHIMPGRAA